MQEVVIPVEDFLDAIRNLKDGSYSLDHLGWPSVRIDWRLRANDKLLIVIKGDKKWCTPFEIIVFLDDEPYYIDAPCRTTKPIEVDRNNLIRHLSQAERVIARFSRTRKEPCELSTDS